jgi:hypothetical protein
MVGFFGFPDPLSYYHLQHLPLSAKPGTCKQRNDQVKGNQQNEITFILQYYP